MKVSDVKSTFAEFVKDGTLSVLADPAHPANKSDAAQGPWTINRPIFVSSNSNQIEIGPGGISISESGSNDILHALYTLSNGTRMRSVIDIASIFAISAAV